MKKTEELGTKPIGKLLAEYSIPAVIAMLVNAIYNVVDRVFIGQYAGEAALAGLTISFPIMMIMFAFANLIGIGGASLLAIKLGEGKKNEGSLVFANTITLAILTAIVSLLAISLNLGNILNIFGASGDVLGYAQTYMSIILMGFIFQMLSFVLNSSVRTEGQPLLSMVAMISSALTNILLDYVFIVVLAMGVAGAAYATIIGQLVGLIVLASFYLRGRSNLTLSMRNFVVKLSVVKSIITIGFATFVTSLGTSVAMTFLNVALSSYGGTEAITSMGAINSLYTFFIMPIMGMTQGIQPIIGYNHGAKKHDRVMKVLKLGIGVGVLFSTIVFILLEAFPSVFISMFLDPSSATIDVAVNGLRLFILSLPLLSINFMGVAYFQSTARGTLSIILGSLRQFVLLIPLLYVLPGMFDINGVWMATPIADAIAVLITFLVLINFTGRGEQGEAISQNA